MIHNRASNLKNLQFNPFAETRWSGPKSRKDVKSLSKKNKIMKFNPSDNWNKEEIRPMHWDPSENWNAHPTLVNMMQSQSQSQSSPSLPHTANEYVPPPHIVAAVHKHQNKVCLICGNTGHIKKNCPYRPEPESRHRRRPIRASRGGRTKRTKRTRRR